MFKKKVKPKVKTALGIEDVDISETLNKPYPGKEKVKIVTVQTVNPRKVYLCGQELQFYANETRVLRSDKIKSFDEVLIKLTNPLSPVVKILEVKEE